MNRTALSVVALAVGAVLIIGLYNIYNPQVKGMSHDVFDKIHISRMAGNSKPANSTNGANARQLKNGFEYIGNDGNVHFSGSSNDEGVDNTKGSKDIIAKKNLDMTHPYMFNATFSQRPSAAQSLAIKPNSREAVYLPKGVNDGQKQQMLNDALNSPSVAPIQDDSTSKLLHELHVPVDWSTAGYKPVSQSHVFDFD